MPRAHDKIPRDHQLPVVLVQSADLSLPLIPLYPTTPLEQFDQLTRLALPLLPDAPSFPANCARPCPSDLPRTKPEAL